MLEKALYHGILVGAHAHAMPTKKPWLTVADIGSLQLYDRIYSISLQCCMSRKWWIFVTVLRL